MNAQNTSATKPARTIIARYDDKLGPLAVLADDIVEGDTFQAFAPQEGKIVYLSKDAYRHTERMSKADAERIRDTYARFAEVDNVGIRERAPYVKRKADEVPSRLVDVDVSTGDVKIDQQMIAAEKDTDKKAVMEHINKTNIDQKPKRRYTKKADYWKNPTKTRRAKPIEAQTPAVEAAQQDATFRQAEEAANKAVQNARRGKALDAETIARIVSEAVLVAVDAALKKAA